MNNNTFENNVSTLLDTFVDNCNNAEEIALGIVCSQHMPLLNTTMCLSKEDCQIILTKCQMNSVEYMELLIAMTDFISCVCANNEAFPLASKKNEKKSIKLILHMIQTSWGKILLDFNAKRTPSDEVNNIVKILKRCVERIPSKIYSSFIKIILQKIDVDLLGNGRPTTSVMQTNSSSSINDSSDNSLSNSKTDTKKTDYNVKCEENCVENDLLKKTFLEQTNDTTHSRKDKKSHKIKMKNGSTSNKVNHLESDKTKTKSFHEFDSKNGIKEKKRTLKTCYDITKFTLKSCENISKDSPVSKEEIAPQKRKFHEMNGKQPDNIAKKLKEPFLNAKIPVSKKSCVYEDFINGKVNAFTLLMRPQKCLVPEANQEV